jgi:hypothetical protein
MVGRRCHDHLADRAGVVEDEPERRPQRADVERLGPAEPVLLGDGEQQLQAHRGRIRRVASGELEQHRDRRLVVGAEDRLAAAAIDTVGQLHLNRAVVRNGVEMGGQHQPALVAPRQPRQQVPGPRLRRPGRVVLAELEAELAQLGGDHVRHGPLVPGGTRRLTEPDEAVVKAGVLAHLRKAMRA